MAKWLIHERTSRVDIYEVEAGDKEEAIEKHNNGLSSLYGEEGSDPSEVVYVEEKTE